MIVALSLIHIFYCCELLRLVLFSWKFFGIFRDWNILFNYQRSFLLLFPVGSFCDVSQCFVMTVRFATLISYQICKLLSSTFFRSFGFQEFFVVALSGDSYILSLSIPNVNNFFQKVSNFFFLSQLAEKGTRNCSVPALFRMPFFYYIYLSLIHI